MITKLLGFKASDGTVHETIEGAQEAELYSIFKSNSGPPNDTYGPNDVARLIIHNKEAILNILTTGPKSRPKARAVNGAKRTRKPKPTLSEAVAKHQPEISQEA